MFVSQQSVWSKKLTESMNIQVTLALKILLNLFIETLHYCFNLYSYLSYFWVHEICNCHLTLLNCRIVMYSNLWLNGSSLHKTFKVLDHWLGLILVIRAPPHIRADAGAGVAAQGTASVPRDVAWLGDGTAAARDRRWLLGPGCRGQAHCTLRRGTPPWATCALGATKGHR